MKKLDILLCIIIVAAGLSMCLCGLLGLHIPKPVSLIAVIMMIAAVIGRYVIHKKSR